jgi:2-C-methyl-D-erythritol 4-phosphate cytidylyltransferase/2-C-methyl-D-erythritol 2,4-cyclodiphosphate synthase
VRVGVIIVAAGQGSRIGGSVPKQLLDLGGATVLRRSLGAFDQNRQVSQIVVVLPEAQLSGSNDAVGTLARPCVIVAGGARRQDSVANGFAALATDVDVVLIHDAARPFVSQALIDRVIAAAFEIGAVVPAIPVRDTVKRVDGASRLIVATIPRDEVWLAQTPQGFRRGVLQAAVALGAAGAEATDEAMLAEQAGHPVKIVDGEIENMKITTPQDLIAARGRFNQNDSGSRFAESGKTTPGVLGARVGSGYDLHRLEAGRPLVLAGVVVPFEKGPVAHSDGDVLCHSLVDAILGAAGAGDIGRHFPNTDAAWKDASGLDLLARSLEIVRRLGWSVANADVTIVLERPKLAGYVPQIAERLAATLGISADSVGVKAKTNEGVDAVGRGEAIAAHAVVMLVASGEAVR